ncbi:MAG: hypothetical protein LBJ09_02335 [Clostridiales bacterium]|jgi:hypothetical protein|nr:hypothetical protein [Clostridiales bacterium]
MVEKRRKEKNYRADERGRSLKNEDRDGVFGDRITELEEKCERRNQSFRDPICIHTDQVYDSCKERDCIRDQRVYFTSKAQEIIDRSINVKVKSAEIIWIYNDVEPVPFNRGYFSIDIKYFIKVTIEAFKGISNPLIVEGLTTFDKKVILFGSEGNAKIFQSKFDPEENISKIWQKNNLPKAVVEVVDPIALTAKLVDEDECCRKCDNSHFVSIPDHICNCFDDELVVDTEGKQVLVTLGLFTIVKVERSVQLLVKAIDFCIPQKDCPEATENNPCDLFNKLRFPMDEFFPPQKSGFKNELENVCQKKHFAYEDDDCGCGGGK